MLTEDVQEYLPICWGLCLADRMPSHVHICCHRYTSHMSTSCWCTGYSCNKKATQWLQFNYITITFQLQYRVRSLANRTISHVTFPQAVGTHTQNICCNHSIIWIMWLYYRVMSPNNADGMANSVDPDQTAPLGAVWSGAVWSGSALFAQAYPSKNLGSLRYMSVQWGRLSNYNSITSQLLCNYI